MNNELNLDAIPEEEFNSDKTSSSFSKMSILNNDNQNKEQQYKELLKEKQQYQALFDLAPICYILIDRKGRIQNANINTMELLNSSRRQLVGQIFYTYLGIDERKKFKVHLKEAFNTVDRIVLGILFDSKAGKKFLELHSSRFNENLALVALVDKTDKWEAENKVKEMLVRVKESDALKSAFLANVSHEIRTPVNAILGFSHILGDNINNDHNKELLKIIKESSQNLLAIFDNIIELSKIVSGHIKLQASPMAINSMLLNVYNEIMPKCKRDEATLNLKLELFIKNKDFIIEADEEKLTQVLNLLLENALKFTKEGLIQISCEKINEGKKELLKFYLKDTGIGISESKMNVIFNPFRQADDSLSRRYEGAGIGLSICKGLVEMMGGEIDVVSKLGKGSVFSFSIPYNAVDVPELFESENVKLNKNILILGTLDNELINICESFWESELSLSFLNTISEYKKQSQDKLIDGIIVQLNGTKDVYDYKTIEKIKELFPNAIIGAYSNEHLKNTDIAFSFFFSSTNSPKDILGLLKRNLDNMLDD